MTAGNAFSRPQRSLRVGLLVDGLWGSKYTYDFAKWAADHSNISITHLIVHNPQAATHPRSIAPPLADSVKSFQTGSGPARFLVRLIVHALRFLHIPQTIYFGPSKVLSSAFLAAVLRKERRLLRAVDRHKDHFDEFDLSILVPESITITPLVSQSGFVYRFSEADVRRVKLLELDLLIRCGSSLLCGEILKAAKLGIISFHHADNRVNRGGPPAFWEVYLRQDTTGFTIQRLTEELDGGDVLMRGHFRTLQLFLFNQAALFEKSNYYLKLVVDRIARTGRLPSALQNAPYSNKLLRAPNLRQTFSYMVKQRWRLGREFFTRLVGIDYRWGVAYIKSDWPNAELWRGIKLNTPSLGFLADPFVISRDGQDFCFVEHMDYRKGLGTIAVYNITDKNHSVRVGTALAESFHLSFPFLFHYENQLFMCPETHQRREIRIYRCIEFPLQWALEKVIMKDVSAVDTMLFEKDGRWWMFTNIDSTGTGDYSSELRIFSANSPFEEKWRPHPLNPIFVDASRARNGGLIHDGYDYFRISQAQGFDLYGKEAHINKITELTEYNYAEMCVGEIKPTFYPGLAGTHHLHSNGRITVFDFVTVSWTSVAARKFAGRVRNKARQLLDKVANFRT